jgi:hypothetical protein
MTRWLAARCRQTRDGAEKFLIIAEILQQKFRWLEAIPELRFAQSGYKPAERFTPDL